jgi:hypothetical protein
MPDVADREREEFVSRIRRRQPTVPVALRLQQRGVNARDSEFSGSPAVATGPGSLCRRPRGGGPPRSRESWSTVTVTAGVPVTGSLRTHYL